MFRFVLILSVIGLLPNMSWQSAPNVRSHRNRPALFEDICGDSYADRIIGGINATLGQYPWIARLEYSRNGENSFECGASLITDQHVLTAAHCVTDLPPDMVLKRIVLGELNSETDPDCEFDECADPVQLHEPSSIFFPENYNSPTHKHDIAVIKLKKKVNFTDWVSPICLPLDNKLETDYVKNVAEVAGWGHINNFSKKSPAVLQTVKIPIVDMKNCTSALYGTIELDSLHQICAGGEADKDSCAGDSGGPLMKAMSSKFGPKYFLIGIVSFGDQYCGSNDAPAVYTRVTSYMEYILNLLAK